MKKQFFLSLALLWGTLASFGQDFTVGGINYTVTSSTNPLTVKVAQHIGFTGIATIPASVVNSGTTYAVTSIGDYAFNNCSGLTSVSIPNSVTSIGTYAFLNCTGLTSVNIPNSVTSIGGSAFNNCTGLTSVNIPNSVRIIGEGAFAFCSGLTSINIPNSVTNIDENAFYSCTGLTSVTVNWQAPISITPQVFEGVELSGVTLNVPAGRVAAYDTATNNVWTNFSPISEIVVAPVIGQTFTASGINYIVTKATLPYEAAVHTHAFFTGTANIPASIANLGNTFAVTSIVNYAFNNCSGLTSVNIPNSVASIPLYTFYNCTSLTSVNIPNSVTSIGESAFAYCSGLTSINIPNSVASIGEGAFTVCTGLTSITIPNSVTSIGNYRFDGCTVLTSVNIPNSVTRFGNYTFSNCTGLTSVNIPNSVTSIGEGAFYNCDGLTSVNIPNSVTSIGSNAFAYCSGLTSVSISNSVTSIADGTFYNCYGLTSITIPNSVTTIGEGTFIACRGLTSVTIPDSVTSIGNYAFNICTGLISITIPNSVTSIGNSVFSSCASLTSVTLPGSVTSISEGTFYNCSSLTSVNIPNSVTSIGKRAFYSCYSLTSVNIPSSVTSIGQNAFGYCTGLTSVTVNWQAPISINADVFIGVTVSGVTLNVPAGTVAAYDTTTDNVWTNFSPIIGNVCSNVTTFSNGAWSNGIPDSATTAIFESDYTATANLTACAVTVSGTANVVFPYIANLTVTNGVTVASTASLVFDINYSNLIQINAATNTGNIVYKVRKSLKRLDYAYWSSPVANQKLLDFTPNTLPNRFYTFDEPTNAFAQVASPAATNFNAAKGYSLRAPNNFTTAQETFNGVFTGVPNNGNFTVPVTITAGQGIGYNLIGNPYPSNINGTAFLQANGGALYFWTHQSYYDSNNVLQNSGGINYASFSLTGGAAASQIPGGFNDAPTGHILPGEGFMFLTPTNRNVNFTNTMRTGNFVVQEQEPFRLMQINAAAQNNKLWLNLSNANGAFSQTLIAYLPNTTAAFDDGYDAKQINTGNVLSSKIANDNYAIQSRGDFFNADVVKLNLNIANAGNYTLSKDNTNGIFANSQDFFLRDNLLGTTHNIKQSPYNFVAQTGNLANRFEIVYQATLSNNNNIFDNANVIVFEQNGLLNISATDDLKSVKIFDIQGRNIFETSNINAKATTLNGFRAQQQVLMVQITNSNNNVVTKKVIF